MNIKGELILKKKSLFKKLLIAVSCVIGVLILGFITLCVVVFIKDNIKKDDREPQTTSIYEQTFEIEEGKDDFVSGDSTPINITLNSQSLEEFEVFLSNIEVDYQFSDVYNIDRAL